MSNLTYQQSLITPQQRSALKEQRPCILWLTGLSGSGKSTLANALEHELFTRRCHTMVLDGDNLRLGLNRDLGFTPEDRRENIRRIGEVSRLFVQSGLIVITAFISPFRADRRAVRSLVAPGEFIEIFMDTPLEVCEARDVKGLYRRARNQELREFTGISSPYEAPEHPELRIRDLSVADAAARVLGYLAAEGHIHD